MQAVSLGLLMCSPALSLPLCYGCPKVAYEMIDVLSHDSAPVRLYWAGDNLGKSNKKILCKSSRSTIARQRVPYLQALHMYTMTWVRPHVSSTARLQNGWGVAEGHVLHRITCCTRCCDTSKVTWHIQSHVTCLFTTNYNGNEIEATKPTVMGR